MTSTCTSIIVAPCVLHRPMTVEAVKYLMSKIITDLGTWRDARAGMPSSVILVVIHLQHRLTDICLQSTS